MPESLAITEVRTNREKREYLGFLRSLYRGNRAWKDLQSHLADSFLRNGDRFIRSCSIEPLMVRDAGIPVAQAMLVSHPDFDYQQVAFLECSPGRRDAVELVLGRARQVARHNGRRRIVVGLNGHVAYGVGFLRNRFDEPISFDSLYTAPWLCGILESLGMDSDGLSTYKAATGSIRDWDPASAGRASGSYSVRTWDKSRFSGEIRLFGELANECLSETPLYFPRDPDSLVELLSPLRPLLRPEHLLFAMHRGREIGFLFWHPDFNEVVPGGRAAGLVEIALRSWFFGSRIRNLKINALGIASRHRGSDSVRLLLRELDRRAAGRFDTMETNFVWDRNLESTRLNRRHFGEPHRRYRVYFMDADR
jgi:hypothetical protein